MITEPSEFMQQLQAIQDSTSVTYSTLPSDEPRFIIDANTRSITIPPEFQFLGVKNDHKAETIYFEIDRYFDAVDLSTHTCVVQFSNSSNSGLYPVTVMDTETVDGKIIFGWEIMNDVTAIVGNINFSVRFYSVDENSQFIYNFNTLTANSVILDTLDVDNPGVVENYPSELEAWLDRMNDLSQNVVKPEDVQALDTKMDTLETSFGELKTNVNSSVDELKSDLADYELKEKILTIGEESGWYGISGNTITENEHATWTRTHLVAPFSFNSLRFEVRTSIKCVFVVKNGVIDFYDIVGNYDIDVSNASDIYINFFGSALNSDYTLYSAYKPYENGYIHFKVPVNQAVVLGNNTEAELKDSESIHNVTCHLKLPVAYRPYGKKTKLLMVCHGAGRGVTVPNPTDNGTWEDNTNYNALIDTFVNAGYAIFDCNGYREDFWGCNFWGAHRGVECWRKAYDYIIKNYNVEENVSIYGFSMGGLTALNLVMNGFPNVKVVALGSPVLDPQKAFENGQAVIMGGAYGMGDTWEPIKARGCSPIERIITIGDTEMILQNLPPIKIWYGSTEQDQIVNKNYASRFVNAIINGGGYATYREVEGENHRICFGAVQYINNEYLYWINRFNNY